MKRSIFVIIAFLIMISLTGCDAVQRKFTRKKTVVKTPHFYQLKKYTRKPSPELYKQHFAYWESWQEELIEFIGQNHKKDVRAMEEALGHLKDMQNILVPSKAEAMQPHIERMEGAKEIIARGDLGFAVKESVRNTLEKEDRAIRRDFCYERVKNDLRTSLDEEAAPHLTMATGKEAPGGSEK